MKILRAATTFVLALVVGVPHVWGGILLARRGTLRLGNTDENVGHIPPPDLTGFRFAVMGDPENGLNVWEEALRKAKETNCALILVNGDLVAGAHEQRYRYFLCRSASAGFDRPIFAAIGNMDIPRRRDKSYGTRDLFHRFVGPEDFFFKYGNSLFILLDNSISEPTPAQLAWLEDVLKRNRASVRYAFLFTHRPLVPFRKGDVDFPIDTPDCPALVEMIHNYSVQPFAAHLHSYRKIPFGNTVHIITGGAGGTLQEPQAFYHYLQMDVTDDAVRDTVVRLEDVSSPWEKVERIVVADFFFFLQSHPWLYILLGLMVGGVVVWWFAPPGKNQNAGVNI